MSATKTLYSGITFSFWAKTASTTETYLSPVSVSADSYLADPVTPRFYVRQSDSSYIAVNGTTDMRDEKWHFYAVTYDGGSKTLTLYIDGVATSTAVGTQSQVYLAGQGNFFYIGRAYGYYYFDGTIDEVGVWSRALSSTEVSELYNSGAGCQYSFSACSGASAPARPPMMEFWGGFFHQRGGQVIIY